MLGCLIIGKRPSSNVARIVCRPPADVKAQDFIGVRRKGPVIAVGKTKCVDSQLANQVVQEPYHSQDNDHFFNKSEIQHSSIEKEACYDRNSNKMEHYLLGRTFRLITDQPHLCFKSLTYV
ncbi:hypothetical protein J6590_023758 [Homalodisca vitripennis]|nr:hypothetical protein J6590_023758 [Homalodisca vitripennis]